MEKHTTLFLVGVMAAFTASADNNWGLAGDGTQDNPYQIASADDFAKLASKISKENTGAGEYFAMMQDVDFGGSESKPVQFPSIGRDAITNVTTVDWGFEGTFDGRNHTITGIYHTEHNMDKAGQFNSLFSSVGENGVIKNVIFGEDNYVWSYNYVAAIASLSKGTISNCHNKADLLAQNAFAGGICGHLLKGLGTITDCTNTGEIKAMTYACGILGGCQSGAAITDYKYSVSDCQNEGNMWTANFTGAAGIAGSFSGTIKDCVNNGNISGNDDYTYSKQYNSGVVACASYPLSIESCTNKGVILGYNKSGGVVGNVMKGDESDVTINGCLNTGAVTMKGSNVAGIVGNSIREKGIVTVSNCRNEGEVTTTLENADTDNEIGNIIGSSLIAMGEGNTYAIGLTSYNLDEGAEQTDDTDDDNGESSSISVIAGDESAAKDGKYIIGGSFVIVKNGTAYGIDGRIISL